MIIRVRKWATLRLLAYLGVVGLAIFLVVNSQVARHDAQNANRGVDQITRDTERLDAKLDAAAGRLERIRSEEVRTERLLRRLRKLPLIRRAIRRDNARRSGARSGGRGGASVSTGGGGATVPPSSGSGGSTGGGGGGGTVPPSSGAPPGDGGSGTEPSPPTSSPPPAPAPSAPTIGNLVDQIANTVHQVVPLVCLNPPCE